jgi:hypothetical protein
MDVKLCLTYYGKELVVVGNKVLRRKFAPMRGCSTGMEKTAQFYTLH